MCQEGGKGREPRNSFFRFQLFWKASSNKTTEKEITFIEKRYFVISNSWMMGWDAVHNNASVHTYLLFPSLTAPRVGHMYNIYLKKSHFGVHTTRRTAREQVVRVPPTHNEYWRCRQAHISSKEKHQRNDDDGADQEQLFILILPTRMSLSYINSQVRSCCEKQRNTPE